MRGIRPASALLLLVAPPGKRTLTVPAAIAKSQGQICATLLRAGRGAAAMISPQRKGA